MAHDTTHDTHAGGGGGGGQLAVNERLREALEEEDGSITLPHEIMAGGGAGFCQVIATNPMEIGTCTHLGARDPLTRRTHAFVVSCAVCRVSCRVPCVSCRVSCVVCAQ
jgi:hypothetical protein